ncbi:MAG: 5-formyltetrahydrofolate cyclo-ligase [Myxococcales bacterium]|nr:5-formyltetrahydrofolate cyclo-ligase [Myxococcales bacterium]
MNGADPKRALRRRLRRALEQLPESVCRAQSAALCRRLQLLPELASARVVAGYAAFGSEADPAAALAWLGARGVVLGLPRIVAGVEAAGDGGRLELHRVDEGTRLLQNRYAIAEPDAAEPLLSLSRVEVILVPALGVDREGRRLGRGGGYYDRLLPRLPQAFKVALVHDLQLIEQVPSLPHDARVDCIVSDLHTHYVR